MRNTLITLAPLLGLVFASSGAILKLSRCARISFVDQFAINIPAVHVCLALAVMFLCLWFGAVRYILRSKQAMDYTPFALMILPLEVVHAFFTLMVVYLYLK